MYYTFPTSAEQAARDMLEAAPKLLHGNARDAGEMAARVRDVMRQLPVVWLPTVDRLLRNAEPSLWTELDPAVFSRPRPKWNLEALIELGACHPRPDMRVWALRTLDRDGAGLHYILLRIDDAEDGPRNFAYAAAERRLVAPGSAHVLVANLPLLEWLRTDGRYDHSAFLDRVEERLQTDAGRRALTIAAERAEREEIREAARRRLPAP